MIATSVSSTQVSLYGSHSPQHVALNGNEKKEELEENNNNSLESESKKLTKKAFTELSKDEQLKVQQLKNRDLEVKAHEQAHLSAAGTLAIGGASFSYTTGPNGVRYATGGEVSIDTSKVEGDPAATLRKADAIRRAALAPATPSAQDQAVASNATAMADTARTDLIEQTQEEQKAKTTTEKTEDETDDDVETDKIQEETKTQSNNSNSIPGSLLDISV